MHFPLVHFRNKTYRSGGASVGGRENVYCGYWVKGEPCPIPTGWPNRIKPPRKAVALRIERNQTTPYYDPRARCELVSQVLGKHISEGGKISKHWKCAKVVMGGGILSAVVFAAKIGFSLTLDLFHQFAGAWMLAAWKWLNKIDWRATLHCLMLFD